MCIVHGVWVIKSIASLATMHLYVFVVKRDDDNGMHMNFIWFLLHIILDGCYRGGPELYRMTLLCKAENKAITFRISVSLLRKCKIDE